jgi:hypothetical protein
LLFGWWLSFAVIWLLSKFLVPLLWCISIVYCTSNVNYYYHLYACMSWLHILQPHMKTMDKRWDRSEAKRSEAKRSEASNKSSLRNWNHHSNNIVSYEPVNVWSMSTMP